MSAIRIQFLLRELAAVDHLAAGRLTGMPYPNARSEPRSTAHLDAFLLSTDSKTVSHRRILSFLYALGGDLNKAGQELRQLAAELPNDATIQNDAGVMEMGLGASDPTAWLVALRQFESALASRPDFPEAKFNLILSYRHLGLRKLETGVLDQYQKTEPELAWRLLIKEIGKPQDEVTTLAERIESSRPNEISDVVRRYAANARQLILNFAFRPILPIPSNYSRVAKELSDQYGDDTAQLALEAISTNASPQIILARELVETGHKLYLEGHLEESHKAFTAAKNIAARTNSLFDQLWIEINDADIMVKLLDYPHAAEAYHHAAETSRQHHLQWLLARSLSSLGSEPALSGGTVEAMSRLNEAVQVYRAIRETTESARPLYYLAGYHLMAASFEDGLRFALESLNAAEPGDHLRLTQLDWLISEILFRMGYSEIAIRFNEESADHAEKLGNPRFIALSKTQLASAYLMSDRTAEAANQLEEVQRVLLEMSAADRDLVLPQINLLRGRIAILLGNSSVAESELRKNLSPISKHPHVSWTKTDFQSRMFLAKTLEAQGRTKDASQELREAIKLVEAHQDQLPQNDLQLTFDQDRREVYEAAIELEYSRNDCEESWNLTQGYKAKLFLNLLNGFGPVYGGLPTHRLTLSQVQKRIPNNVQIVEYAVLGDQLLAWVISKDHFQCRATPVSASQLREKINLFLSRLTQRQPTQESSRDLYDLLVQPISEFLDPTQTVAVIPDGDLYRLPFSALQSRRDNRYLVERMPILESPSVTYLFSGSEIRSLNSAHVAFGSRVHDAFANAELNTLQDIEPGIRLKVGAEVTKDAFLKALRDHSLLYYAGHSAFDMRNALQSAILLDGGRPGPNAVSALDIMKQRIARNAMIILSSCETSSGNTIDGPGIRGLTSAFLVGGAGSVVGSIWPVESSGTMQLISAAFRFLVEDHRPIINSLQAAQIQMIHHTFYEHPYYWSGFVVTGNLSAADQHFLNTAAAN